MRQVLPPSAHMPPVKADETRQPSTFSPWIIAVGLIAGLLLGLAISWALGPLPESNTEPYQLRTQYRNLYMVAIALEYQQSGNLQRALNKLIALRPVQDPFQALADAACDLAKSGYLQSDSGIRALRLVTDFVSSQGRGGCAEQLLPPAAAGDGVAPEPSPAVDLPSTIALPTKTPPSRPLQPTATLRVVATALPRRQFVPRPASTFCDPDYPALIEVYVVDYLGRGIPGQRIRVRWGSNESIFVSGLKLDRGEAYADFQMDEGIGYAVDMPASSDALGAELKTASCFAPNGRESLKSYRVTFVDEG